MIPPPSYVGYQAVEGRATTFCLCVFYVFRVLEVQMEPKEVQEAKGAKVKRWDTAHLDVYVSHCLSFCFISDFYFLSCQPRGDEAETEEKATLEQMEVQDTRWVGSESSVAQLYSWISRRQSVMIYLLYERQKVPDRIY